jgi:hypothetical protein
MTARIVDKARPYFINNTIFLSFLGAATLPTAEADQDTTPFEA